MTWVVILFTAMICLDKRAPQIYYSELRELFVTRVLLPTVIRPFQKTTYGSLEQPRTVMHALAWPVVMPQPFTSERCDTDAQGVSVWVPTDNMRTHKATIAPWRCPRL